MAAVPAPLLVTNTTVWPYWNSLTNATCSGQTGATLLSTTWTNWNYAYSTSSTSSTQFLQIGNNYTWTNWNTVYEETAEQRAEREQRAAQAREAAAAERAILETARAAARDRALELLGYVLSDEQMRTYREQGWFEVRSSTGRRWRIRDRGQSGNVDLMPEIGDERLASYCAHPPFTEGRLPDPDAHLAQALTLVTDEGAFLRVANCQYRRPAAA